MDTDGTLFDSGPLGSGNTASPPFFLKYFKIDIPASSLLKMAQKFVARIHNSSNIRNENIRVQYMQH